MATYGNFEGTFKDTVQIGKQGAKIEKSPDESFTLYNDDKSARVDIHAKDATFDGTGAVTFPVGLIAEQPGTPKDGMIRYNSENKTYEGYSARLWRDLSFDFTPYNISFFGQGTQPVASSVIGSFAVPRDMKMPSCMNSIAKVKIASATDISFNVTVNDSSIGTITFNTGQVDGVLNLTTTDLVPGDLVELVNSATPDSVISDVMVSISGELTTTCPLPLPPQPPVNWGSLPPWVGMVHRPDNTSDYVAFCAGDGKFVYGPMRGGLGISSDKGVTWVEHDLTTVIPLASYNILATASVYSNGRFIFVNHSESTDAPDVLWTTDFVTWTYYKVKPVATNTRTLLVADGTGNLFQNTDSGSWVSSDNADSFTKCTNLPAGPYLQVLDAAYMDGYLYIAKLLTTDEIGLHRSATPATGPWEAIPGTPVQNNNRGTLIEAGNGNLVYTSDNGDGSSYLVEGNVATVIPHIFDNQGHSIVSHYYKNLVIAVDSWSGDPKDVSISEDNGVTWADLNQVQNPFTGALINMANVEDTWISAGVIGKLIISPPL